MEKQAIHYNSQPEAYMAHIIQDIHPDKVFVLTDEHTIRHCLPHFSAWTDGRQAYQIAIPAGDTHKTVDTLTAVWRELSRHGATRHSLLVNLGGGMVTDLGGFAAATFKRGMACVNIPTTLLGMVDAAVGGKTGINLDSLKNEVGAFAPAHAVVIDTTFLQTLDRQNLLSGFAEMLKHGLISDEAHLGALLRTDPLLTNAEEWSALVARSVQVKAHIVEQDPFEHGIRKALNLGHTVGHALESFAMSEGKPVLHGYAVAWGLVCELYLSTIKLGFPSAKMRRIASYVRDNYGSLSFDCSHYDTLYEWMRHDKKNVGTDINFTLLSDVGQIVINQTIDKDLLWSMLDFYRECMRL